MNYKFAVILMVLLGSIFMLCFAQEKEIYYTNKGTVYFISENHLETIYAKSSELKGIYNTANRNFAFAIRIASFDGFNGALQREHFNENYMESEVFSTASFQGKIIDPFNSSKDGTYLLRAKGILKIHGEEQEKIVKVTLIKSGAMIKTSCNFSILLSDYEIKIPRIVHEKISPEIKIEVRADLIKK